MRDETRLNAPANDTRPAWFGGAVFVIGFFALLAMLQMNEERERTKERELAAAEERWHTITIRDCPRPRPGMTETVVLIVRSTADDLPTVTGCSRIAERSFAAGSGARK